ncbi:MAG: AAA family ATPase [Desulfobacteraceae bacterium]|nr:AAA family ATPase [Desulfobacteraceae bacterium]
MTAKDQDMASKPTVQELFHPSFPDIPWPVREKHEFQEYVPAASEYHFRPEITADFLGWMQFGGLSCLISGPTGSGKSSLVNEVAARSNIPVYPVVAHNRLEPIDMTGQYVPTESGGFSFEYGPLPLAMKAGGIFLLDEIDTIDPATLVAMNAVLDGRPLVLSANDGEVIHPQEGFRIIATANTTGHGDGEAKGGYIGTLRMSKSFMNRLQWTFIVDYPEAAVEMAMVSEILGNDDIATQMVHFANEIREMHTSQETRIPDTLSTREIKEWAKATLFFQKVPRISNPLSQALKYVVVNKASEEGRPVIGEIYQRIFNTEL